MREEISYKLACDAQGNLVLRKWRKDEYHFWKKTARPGERTPANIDFFGPDTIPIERCWLARNYGYKRSVGV